MFKLEDDVYLGRLVDIIDCDGNGTIDFREFVVGLAAFVLSGSFGRVRFAFRLFDLNNDGSFSKRELLTAIRAAESRHEASRDAREKRSANYWGDRAVPDPLVRYKDLIGDLDARPDEMGYEEFTRIVTRHPRVFAPVNQMWHALRQYADPAVKVVMQIRQSGNARFFRGTVLEPGRAEQIFAPPGSSPSSRADGATDAQRRGRDENAHPSVRRRKKVQSVRRERLADREEDETGLMRDGSRLRRWLDDAASSVKRTAAVGLERVSSFGSPGRASRAKTRAPAWEADARARSRAALREERGGAAGRGFREIARTRVRCVRARGIGRRGRRRGERRHDAGHLGGARRAEPEDPAGRRRRASRFNRGGERFGSSAARRRRRRRAAARGLLPHAGRRRAREAAAAAARPRRRCGSSASRRAARAERGGGGRRRPARDADGGARPRFMHSDAERRPGPRRGAAGRSDVRFDSTPEETGLMCSGTTKARTSRTRRGARGGAGARATRRDAAATTRVSPAGSSRASSGTPPRGRLRKRRAWDCEMCRRR